jgi:hypothetical protein
VHRYTNELSDVKNEETKSKLGRMEVEKKIGRMSE